METLEEDILQHFKLHTPQVSFEAPATVALLRWLDRINSPLLQGHLSLRNWEYVTGTDQEYLLAELAAHIGSLSTSRGPHRNLAVQLRCLAPSVKNLSSLGPDGIGLLVDWASNGIFEANSPNSLLDMRRSLDYVTSNLSTKQASQFFTPRLVAETMVALAQPRWFESIYDPCFGSAGLLTSAVDFIRENEGDRSLVKQDLELIGVENSVESFTLGLTRLALSGVRNPRLKLGNSLAQSEATIQQDIDIVLMNPPWGSKVDASVGDSFPISSKDGVSLFIQHALSRLKLNGRAVAVVPQSFLFRGGSTQKLRKMLLSEHSVEAVVNMPRDSFRQYASVDSCIVVFRKGGTTSSVRMVDLSHRKLEDKASADRFVGEVLELTRSPSPSYMDRAWDVDFATLEEYDFDLTPLRRDQSSIKEFAQKLGDYITWQPLHEVCSISSGQSIPRGSIDVSEKKRSTIKKLRSKIAKLDETSPAERRSIEALEDKIDGLIQGSLEEANYVRIRNVSNGKISGELSWVPLTAISKNAVRLTLGDVLISKSGTIGKSGIIENKTFDGIASGGFFVLRTKEESQVEPDYLLAFLNSAECKQLLNDRATGMSTKHLSMRSLQTLTVPIPPIEVQRRVVSEYQNVGADALDSLSWELLGQRLDPIDTLLSETWAHVSLSTDPKSLGFTDWDSIANRFSQFICKSTDLELGDKNPLGTWVVKFDHALSPLVAAEKIPDVSSQLVVVNEAAQRSMAAIELVKSKETAAARRAYALNQILVDWLRDQSKSLIGKGKISVVCKTSELVAGDSSELLVDIENEGSLPLRNMAVSTQPEGWGKSKVDFLGVNAKHSLIVNAKIPDELGEFNIQIRWTAQTLTGEPLEGSHEIGFNVVAEENKSETFTELGGSPYICGDPVKVDRNEVFVGRQGLIDQIKRQVIESGNVVLLEGNRRAGKSSLLWHLEGPEPIPGWLGVYCSLQGVDGANEGGIPTADVFRGMASDIAQAIRKLNGTVVLPDGSTLDSSRRLGVSKSVRNGISEESPFQDFREYLQIILTSLADQNLGLLFMMDEFDKLQEGIDNGVTSPQVPENIRFLVQSLPKFSAILTGSRRLQRMREEYWSALFGLGTRFPVTALPSEAAARLITEPVKSRLSFSSSAVKMAANLTARQPYLLQCLCNRMFDIAAQTDIRSINVSHVEHAAQKLVEDNEHFASLWDYTKYERRRFLLFLLHREEDGPDQMRFPVIVEKLTQLGIELNPEVLMSDLEYLRELELVDMRGESSGTYYTLTIPMMGDWLDSQQDYNVTLERAMAEAEDIRESVEEFKNLQSEIQNLEDEQGDDNE